MSVKKESLDELALEIRKDIFKMAYYSGGAHIGASFSIVEVLVSLYFGGVLRYDASNPKLENRDRFILSKGHASAAIYAVLSKAGYFSKEVLYSFCQEGTLLGGHPSMLDVPGIEASTGALGHGINYAVGLALGSKLNKTDERIFVVIGDGECQEGTIWEAAMFASAKNLDNLTVVLDHNKFQAMDALDSIVSLGSLKEKWESFDWQVAEVNGHNTDEIIQKLRRKPTGKPSIIIANTIKGKGVSFMEGEPIWHYRMPNPDELEILKNELGITDMELERL